MPNFLSTVDSALLFGVIPGRSFKFFLPAVFCSFLCLPSAFAADRVSNDHFDAELISSSQAIVPGQAFSVGINFRMKDGWHIYWRNPGDSGLATEINWEFPFGFEAGDLIWPLPEFFIANELINYGYGHEVLLSSHVQGPALMASGARIAVKAELEYLACREICVPGSEEFTKELTVVSDEETLSDKAAVFKEAHALAPQKESLIAIRAAHAKKYLIIKVPKEEGRTLTEFAVFPTEFGVALRQGVLKEKADAYLYQIPIGRNEFLTTQKLPAVVGLRFTTRGGDVFESYEIMPVIENFSHWKDEEAFSKNPSVALFIGSFVLLIGVILAVIRRFFN